MKNNIKELLNTAVQANDRFMKRYKEISTTIGLMDQALRNLGNNSEAVTIDSASLNKKLVFIILDSQPDIVGVGIGKNGGEDLSLLGQYDFKQITTEKIVELLEENLI
ncbi:hypothetical protein [Psychromonas aquimarina]|uniref:hypothetical protein n=1 Tax=Psychromonas aquimarina TaxID=444919 RepID=UPI0004264F88|nr:hypothetical protein [Psychromonas aquimarina]